jgi:hypothetical protein
MSRWLAAALVVAPGIAWADDVPAPAPPTDGASAPAPAPTDNTSAPPPAATDGTSAPAPAPSVSAITSALAAKDGTNAPAGMGDQEIGATLGVAAGGRTTPGGLRIGGHYLYRLSDQDWFDGTVGFVFGGGDAECFRDRMDVVICDHGIADGYAAKVETTFRRFWPQLANDTFWPFTRAGIGASIVRFSDDDTTGITFSLHAGAGLRAAVADGIAVIGVADFELGIGQFSNGVGGEPQLGVNIMAGAEFKL